MAKYELNTIDINPELQNCVLILEGWGTNTELYLAMARHMAGLGFRVMLPDLPGFGKSAEPAESLDNSDYAKIIDDLLTEKKVRRVSIIGHSHGGRITIKAVGESLLNTKVERIVLIGSAGIVHEKSEAQRLKAKRYQTIKQLLGFSPALLEKFKKSQGSDDYRAASPIMRDTLVKVINEDLRHLLPNIKQPTLLIWGENDTDTPIADARLMEKMIPDSGLVTVPNAGHYAHLDNAPFVFRVLDSFLGGR